MHWTPVVTFLICHSHCVRPDPIAPPIPVPNTEPGIRYMPSDPRPTVKLEIFVDLNCPDSNAAWPVVKQVQEHYGNDRLDLVLQQFPLPFHRSAFYSTQGVFVIEELASDYVFNYVEAILTSWDQFSTSKTVDKTDTDIIEDLADIATEATGIEREVFIDEIRSHRPHVVGLWKYAAKRGVVSTPTYFVNGVDIAVGKNYVPAFDEWIVILDPIINDFVEEHIN